MIHDDYNFSVGAPDAQVVRDRAVEPMRVARVATDVAADWLTEHGQYESMQQAARWGFVRWLYRSVRISDHYEVIPLTDWSHA